MGCNHVETSHIGECLCDISLFGMYAVDVETYELVYANQFVKEKAIKPESKYCWESLHGFSEPCSWCRIPTLCEQEGNEQTLSFEFYNEYNNRWYHIQECLINLEKENIFKNLDKRHKRIKSSVSIDITEVKESHGELIQHHVELAVKTKELKEANKRLEYQANTDTLTGISNRRHFFNAGEELFEQAKLHGLNFSLLLLDIDHFKHVNDMYGHSMGDAVLKEVCCVITGELQDGMIFGRLGGEEFAILALNVSQEEAFHLSERIRKRIADEPLEVNGYYLNITISIGTSTLKDDMQVIDDLMKEADDFLYMAKEAGRNRTKGFCKVMYH